MFGGKRINFTEDRSVLHTVLRHEDVIKSISKNEQDAPFEGEKQLVHAELLKIRELCERLHGGGLRGATGRKICAVVNIGIGGSDLGPRMVCEALACYRIPGVNAFFVSNIDPSEMKDVLSRVDLEETMFVVVSKTFTTQETIANARMALEIMDAKMSVPREEISSKHFVAVSSNTEEARKFGIRNVFSMWDFVGGRYSLWSAAGLAIALYVGFDNFLRLLSGASIMDRHFISSPLESSPALHAILELYYNDTEYPTKCIVAYDFYMRSFYLHIQQLDMESNGKAGTKEGGIAHRTGMIVWGGVGTNSQHSFFQLLHQGTHRVLVEFLVPLVPEEEFKTEGHSHHTMVVANCLAQSEALMAGCPSDNVHKNFPGNKPSITICYSKLSPEVLGALIAHYEHKVFVQGLYWGINSFDQFGVQLGKTIASKIQRSIENTEETLDYSPSTNTAIEMARLAKNGRA
ncbi:UNVERIFIED_CONTAM: hypothetical protein PYX00_011743 [Menopon gallinae]|uniref:Glucose-6-phosphate isomerase n=1 Tax=Menopon gallinae TaxID=328185 RepID=A0AAW2H8G3_9NEOP